MPGSLLLGNDAYSDVSDISGRSLDSKIGGKKVSFNKAVRVKQYPWKADSEVNTSDHLTLPSNRFWFKVYKSKNESPVSYNYTTDTSKQNAWEDENMECIHDSLAPIAEVEDQDVDEIPMHTNGILSERNGYQSRNNGKGGNSYNDNYHYHPTEPPVDYFDDMRLISNRSLNGAKQVWGPIESKNDRYDLNNVHTNNSNQCNGNLIRNQYGTIKETDENSEDTNFNSEATLNYMRLPRTNIRSEFSPRRSMRKLDNSDNSKSRERRSRSHDDHIDSDIRYKQLRKTDKSVSTEDLNYDHIPTNRFFKNSRDIATQCYGTLTRNKNEPTFNIPSSSSSQTFSSISNTERLKNFKSPRPRLTFVAEDNKDPTINQKKNYSLEKLSNLNRAREELAKKNNYSAQTEQNYRPYKFESQMNSKPHIVNSKPPSQAENTRTGIMPRQANKTFNRFNSKEESNPISALSKDSRKNRENTNQNNNIRESNTVGYLRGRQIPLSEVNTNTNRKYLSRNNIGFSQNHVSHKANENHSTGMFSGRTAKSDAEVSNGNQSKIYISPINNIERRSFRNSSNSAKNYASSFSERDSRPTIDWSLSGFQLASKQENGITSVSDSEYTVHRRPPLLMYIPGVSHHDRPAIEDDRLSALSDISRSEINDGLSSASANSTRDKNGIGDFRRRQSVREGKLKWMKWRSKS